MVTETIISSAAGLIGGSLVTWFFARRYYLLASRERPEWADALADDVVARYSALHPEQDPGDLVAVFEEALKSRDIEVDGGNF